MVEMQQVAALAAAVVAQAAGLADLFLYLETVAVARLAQLLFTTKKKD
jgi:hypothetical protein